MARANIHTIKDGERVELVGTGIFFEKDRKIDVLEVVLSERNLISLLAKLHIDGAHRTIYNGDVPSGYFLKLVAEDDENHYKDRPRPGTMTSETEELAEAIRKAIEEHQDKRKVIQLFHTTVKQTTGE